MVERVAQRGDATAFRFPIPLAKQKNCDFSFSGLKTRLVRQVAALAQAGKLDAQVTADVAASFQNVVVQHLRDRTSRALQWCRQNCNTTALNALVVCGGAARNLQIRSAMEEVAREHLVEAIFPPPRLCTGQASHY